MTLTSSYPRSALTHFNCNFIHKIEHLPHLFHKIAAIVKWDNLSKNVLKAVKYIEMHVRL